MNDPFFVRFNKYFVQIEFLFVYFASPSFLYNYWNSISLSHTHKCRSHEIFCNSFNSRQSVERGGSKEKSSAKAKLVRKVNKLDGHWNIIISKEDYFKLVLSLWYYKWRLCLKRYVIFIFIIFKTKFNFLLVVWCNLKIFIMVGPWRHFIKNTLAVFFSN